MAGCAAAATGALLTLVLTVVPCLALPSSTKGRQILAGGKPLVLKGVNWNPVAQGRTQNGGVDFRGYVEADSALMAAAGINAVRTYQPITDRQVLDILWSKGIHVLNTVYFSADADVQSVVDPVTTLKDHPAILTWCVGNEWNYNHLYSAKLLYDDALARVAEVTRLIKKIDHTHVVTTIYGMLPSVEQMAALADVDVWGLTAYTGISFGTMFDMWAQRSGNPMFLAEFGADAYNANVKAEDEEDQAKATTALAHEIAGHSVSTGGVCSGGLIFELADEWWKDGEGSPARQDVGGIAPGGGPYPDHVFNEEFWGLVKIDGTPRQAFRAYAALPPVGQVPSSIGAGYRLRACGASPRCAGALGNCCPDRAGVLRGCCSAEARNAAAAAAGPTTPSPQRPAGTPLPACVIEHNFDYSGEDLEGITNVGSAEMCAKLCGANSDCKSFTYGKSGYFARHCWLKRTVKPKRTSNTCCDSGLPCGQVRQATNRAAASNTTTTTAPRTTELPTTTAPPTTTARPTTTVTTTWTSTTTTALPTTTAPPTTTAETSRAPRPQTTSRTSQACPVEHNHDRPGPAISTIDYVASPLICAALCKSHPSCKSYSYVKKIQGCYLKGAAPPHPTVDTCCDAGLPCAQACLVEKNYDYSGDDLAAIGNVDSAQACAQLCSKNGLCRSFTYMKKQSLCYLKSSLMPGRTASLCCDSGLPCSQAQAPPQTALPAIALRPTTGLPSSEGFHVKMSISSKHELVATIFIGSPPQELRCLVDSASADLWIPSMRCRSCGSLNSFRAAASHSFAPETRPSKWGATRRPKTVKLSFGTGEIVGYPVRDTVRFGWDLKVTNQSFIIVEDSTMPPRRAWDGICGLGWRQLGKVHHPLYARIQEEGRRALFTLVPQGHGRATMVVGQVPLNAIEAGSLVWVRAESFQPGTMSQWVQRSFWVATGGLRINVPTPVSVRFLVDTGVSEALLAPPKHYSKFIRSLLPRGAFDNSMCSADQQDGGQVTCSCSILQEDLKPLQIHLGGQPFLITVADLFTRVYEGVQELCRLQIRPNPKASSRQSDMLEGLGGILGGLMSGILGTHAGPGHPQPAPGQAGAQTLPQPFGLLGLGRRANSSALASSPPGQIPRVQHIGLLHGVERRLEGDLKDALWGAVEDPLDELWVLGGMFVTRFVTVFDFDKALLGFARPAGVAAVPVPPAPAAAAAAGVVQRRRSAFTNPGARLPWQATQGLEEVGQIPANASPARLRVEPLVASTAAVASVGAAALALAAAVGLRRRARGCCARNLAYMSLTSPGRRRLEAPVLEGCE